MLQFDATLFFLTTCLIYSILRYTIILLLFPYQWDKGSSEVGGDCAWKIYWWGTRRL